MNHLFAVKDYKDILNDEKLYQMPKPLNYFLEKEEENINNNKNSFNRDNMLLQCLDLCIEDHCGYGNDLAITTSTITCQINLNFHNENIGLYFDDFDDCSDFLIGKRYGNRQSENVIETNILNDNSQKSQKKIFNNQVSFMFNTDNAFKNNLKNNVVKENDLKNTIKTNNDKENDLKNMNKTNNNNENDLENTNKTNTIEKNIKETKKSKNKKPKKIKELKINKLNLKFFENGSIHLTGCNNFNCVKEALDILCKKLSKRKAVFKDGKFQIISYVSEPNELKIDNIFGFEIRMINCCFSMNFEINRFSLDKLLKENGYESNLNQINASVIIKYRISVNSVTTIFVFKSGLITIAGTKSINNLIEAYYFINKFILTHYNQIYTRQITGHTILDLLENMKKEEDGVKQ